MKILRLAVAALSAFFITAHASAQVVDVAKISCKQYLAGNVVRQDYLSLWLSGYYNGTRNDTVIERGTVQGVADKVATYCQSNLDIGLMDAVKNVLSVDK